MPTLWSAPRTWVAGEVVTAALMNTHVRDDLIYLKGTSEVPTIESGLVIDNTGGDEYLKLPLLSTAECTTVLAAEGKISFDEQTHTPKYYNGSAVKDIGDHGSLGGLTDDDHTQYQKESLLTTAGDLPYATGASTWGRLPITATPGLVLQVNTGGNAPEWSSAIPAKLVSSTYTGNDADSRQITVGFACKLVTIIDPAGYSRQWTLMSTTVNLNIIHQPDVSASGYAHVVTAGTNLHASDGFVVSKANDNANNTGITYIYVAIG